MPPAAGCPPPAVPLASGATPLVAGPAPAPTAGAPRTSAAAKASLTERARERVQACGRSPPADVLTSARLHTSCAPHRPRTVDATDRLGVLRRRQRDALAQWRAWDQGESNQTPHVSSPPMLEDNGLLMLLDRDTRRGPRTRVLAVITRRSAHCSLMRTHKPGSPLLLCLGRTPMPLAGPNP